MQTFLPLPDIAATARVLDWRRLGKQRLEALDILRILAGKPSRWANHPAVRIWRGYAPALAEYGRLICLEWIGRGYNDTRLPLILEHAGAIEWPPWLGNDAFHLSHRSNLVRKFPDHYAALWPGTPPDLPYVWP